MWEIIRANRRRAALLVAFMAALLFVVGYAVGELLTPGGGRLGLFGALVVWSGLSLAAYFGGDQILLAASGARRIQKSDHPVLWNVVEEMVIAAGLPQMPEVYLMDEDAPNAFATGRKPERSAVVVTAGLLERLTRDELQGVVAHELGHIKNRDVLYMTMVGVMLGAIVMLADIGTRVLWYGGGRRRTSSDSRGGAEAIVLLAGVVLMVLAPFLAQLMYLALSRRREYLADASSALFTRYPEGLASALEKIAGQAQPLRAANRATAPMYIVNPLARAGRRLADLTSTHPPTSERVRILRSLAGGAVSLARYDDAFRNVTGRAVGVVPAGSARAAAEVAARREASHDPRSNVQRVREATDALWRLQHYAFVACSCGVALKVPPAHQGKQIHCPQCGTPHRAAGRANAPRAR